MAYPGRRFRQLLWPGTTAALCYKDKDLRDFFAKLNLNHLASY